jgi:hypothetical protein
MNAQDQWFVRCNANLVGPVSTELLLRGIREGKIPRDSDARRADQPQWMPLMDVVVAVASAALQNPDMVELGDEARTIVRDSPLRPSAAPGPPKGARAWYVRNAGAVVGPVTTEILLKGIEAGRVPSTSRVCPAGEGTWLPIIAHPTFEKAFPATALPPPVPSAPGTVIVQPDEAAPAPDLAQWEPPTVLWERRPPPFSLPPPVAALPLDAGPRATHKIRRGRQWLVPVAVVGALLLLVLLAGSVLLAWRLAR